MIPVLAFDIETIPDINGIRVLFNLDKSLADREVAEFAFQRRRAQHGNDFLPHHLQRVIAISCVLRWSDKIIIKSIGSPEDSEAVVLQAFFDIVSRYTPQLVSWNGGGFDLPVLHYRSLIHQVIAPRYWDMGESDQNFKWNNYISRYHRRHLDLMDLLALYQPRANAPLDDLAKLCGFPGKQGMDGADVWSAWLGGDIHAIRNYCETDAANTYLMYLRFQLMSGALSKIDHAQEALLIYEWLKAQEQEHWKNFFSMWNNLPETL